MTLVIRPAETEDLRTLQTIERASAQRFLGWIDAIAADEPTSLDALAARCATGDLLVVSDGSAKSAPLAGFVMFRPVDESIYIEQIDVLPAFERRGIGATMLDAVAQRARGKGFPRLTLSTFREIPWNALYYRRLGFADLLDGHLPPGLSKVRQEHQARGLDENARVFMAKAL